MGFKITFVYADDDPQDIWVDSASAVAGYLEDYLYTNINSSARPASILVELDVPDPTRKHDIKDPTGEQ
jgi:hypothetical protein